MPLYYLVIFCVPGVLLSLYATHRYDLWKTRVVIYTLFGFVLLSYITGVGANCNNAFCVDWTADVRDVFTPNGIKVD